MSGSVNKVILVGNLGTDPVIRQTAGGRSVANLSIATNRSYQLADGTTKDSVVWHKVAVWGKQADVCQKYLAKGRKVYVEGSLQSHSWKDKDGQDSWKMEVLCDRLHIISSPRPFSSPDDVEAAYNTVSESDSSVESSLTESLQ